MKPWNVSTPQLEDFVATPDSTPPIGMPVDTVTRKIYRTDQEPNNSRVMRSDLDDANVEDVLTSARRG